ncbi:tryptophanase leader peptide [Photobacterium lutimaris]|uniref:Tryptophanase leader peptide n=1 Tax=Photobacterium lutimaris TaxID=388278 RepID=A0A2T3IY34_9GAMM|nr:tryptophanase leader peptide [Photobacterium lutimaris]
MCVQWASPLLPLPLVMQWYNEDDKLSDFFPLR